MKFATFRLMLCTQLASPVAVCIDTFQLLTTFKICTNYSMRTHGLAVKKTTSIWWHQQTLYSAAVSRAIASVKCRSCSLELLVLDGVMLDSGLRCNRLSTSESCFVAIVGRMPRVCWSFIARIWMCRGCHRQTQLSYYWTCIYQQNYFLTTYEHITTQSKVK